MMQNKVLFFLFILFNTTISYTQTTVTGHIYSKDKEALIGATVLEKGTTNAITTDYEGFFELELSQEKATLIVTYVGFITKEVQLKKDQKEIDIYLESEVLLSEVVVTTSKNESRKDKTTRTGGIFKKGKALSSAPGYDAGGRIDSDFDAPATMAPPPPPPPLAEPKPAIIKEDAYSDVMMEMEEVSSVEVTEESEKLVLDDKITTTASGATERPKAGQLTAGILNDFGKWNLWQDIQENELKEWQTAWEIMPWERYTVQLTTQNAYPIINATVYLKDGDKIVWTTRTDNTGKAELWANMFEEGAEKNYKIEVSYQNVKYKINNVKTFHEGINIKKIPVQCDIKNKVDIAFVVDATGSMGDEISYLKSELNDVITRVKADLKDTELRLGSVFYRDHGDAYLTKKSHFSSDISKTTTFIDQQGAAGGGDRPEAVQKGLSVALEQMNWSDDATTRLLFLILDAPPHNSALVKEELKKQMIKAAEKGIRIIPIACSGTDRSTEYLMRSFALATNGSYIYLTDDSGIGGSHIKPVTDEIKVNMLNDLLVKNILDFSKTVSCNEQIDVIAEEVSDTTTVDLTQTRQGDDPNKPNEIIEEVVFSWKYYPNPSAGDLWIEVNGELDFLYLLDGAGKLLRRIAITDTKIQLDLRQYPSGIYFLKGIGKHEKEVTGKVILTRTY